MKIIIFFGLFVLLSSVILHTSAATVDPTKVGIKNGDEFTFVVGVGYMYSAGYDLETGSSILIAEEDEFMMKITSSEPELKVNQHYQSQPGYYMPVEFRYENDTINSEILMEISDCCPFPIMVLTDWTFWEEEYSDIGTISHADDEFVIKSGGFEVRYGKSTGVIHYFNVFSVLTMVSENLISRTIDDTKSDDGDGFLELEIIPGLVTMLILVYFYRIRKRKHILK